MALTGSSGAASPLLMTKLHVPTPRARRVLRSRLDPLLAPPEATLTVVAAPAGFGKSTVLADRFAGTEARVGWIGLDRHDDDPGVFAAYLATAVHAALGGAPLHDDRDADATMGLHPLVARLLNAIGDADGPFVLVLDDYHVIETPEIHSSVELLVERAPTNLQVVLATRTDPPLPLARWRAGGRLAEVRAAQLRFTLDEAANYLRDTMGLALSSDAVVALEARTEGWIAALQLAALTLRDHDDAPGFIETFAGDDRFVVDFLTEEVLDQQPVEVRRFLLQTSVLQRLGGAACDAVTGADGGAEMLDMLDRANMFVVALDDRRRWYRYHHLFRDALRARLHHEHPALVGELHRRAAEWHIEQRDAAGAIEHALAGGQLEVAAEMIERASPQTRAARQDATLRRWLDALPDEMFDERPVLAMALAGARMATGAPHGVDALLDRAERWLEAEPGGASGRDPLARPIVFDTVEFARLPAQAAVYRSASALLGGDIDGTIDHATAALDLAEPDDHLRGGAAVALIGLARWARGDLEEARARYVDAIARFTAAGFLPDALGCSLALADIQRSLGRIDDAERTYRSALALASNAPGLRGTADMHVGLSEIHLERAQLAAAAAELRRSAELGAPAGLPQHAYRSEVASAMLHRARDETDAALGALERAALVYDTDFSPATQPVEAVRARVLLDAGDVEEALRWASDAGVTVQDDLSYVREYQHLTLAHALVAEPSTRIDPTTSAFLERLRRAARGGGRVRSVVEISTLEAVVLDARGDADAALARICEALALAEPGGYVQVFVEGGRNVARLLDRAASTLESGRGARRILDSWTAGPEAPQRDAARRTTPPSRHRREVVGGLSARELDVLRLLRSDLSGPEIARELHVSLNTLRSHTKSIYTKLGATSRREAVRLASEQGI